MRAKELRSKEYHLQVSLNGVTRQTLWSADKRIRIGYRLPWTLESHGGKLRLAHDEGGFCSIKREQLEGGKPLRLPDVDGNMRVPVYLSLRELEPLKRPFLENLNEDVQTREWHIVEASDNWTHKARQLRKTFFAESSFGRIFRLKWNRKIELYQLLVLDVQVTINGKRVPKGFTMDMEDLAHTQIGYRDLKWWFCEVNKESLKYARRPELEKTEKDGKLFAKSFAGSAAALAALLLLVHSVGGKKEKEKDLKYHDAKIVMKKMIAPKVKPEPKKEPPKEVQVVENKSAAPPQEPKKVVQVKEPPPAPPGKKLAKKEPPKKQPKLAPAVLKAQKLQDSMKKLAHLGRKSALLKKGRTQALKGPRRGSGTVLGKVKRNIAVAPSVNYLGEQRVAVNTKTSGTGNSGYSTGASGSSAAIGANVGKGSYVGVGDGAGVEVADGLSKKEVWDVIRKHLTEVRYCYEAAILRVPNISGKLVVDFTISPAGNVSQKKVESSELKDQRLSSCVLRRLGTWKFPKPKGGSAVSVTYPFVFKKL